MIIEHLFLATAWILFGILHSVTASLWFKLKAATLMKKNFKYYRLIYSLFSLLTFGIILFCQVKINSPLLFKAPLLLSSIGLIISVAGLSLMIYCIAIYFRFLTGIAWITADETDNVLIQKGIHQVVRHPLYLGTLIFIWGLLIVFPYISFLIANVILTVYTLIGMKLEERKLEIEFGKDYTDYKEKVPMLIPDLHYKNNRSAG